MLKCSSFTHQVSYFHYLANVFPIYINISWILCVCSLFSQPPKVTDSWNFGSGSELGQPNIWWRFKILGKFFMFIYPPYTNLYHYHFCSCFPQLPNIMTLWNVDSQFGPTHLYRFVFLYTNLYNYEFVQQANIIATRYIFW